MHIKCFSDAHGTQRNEKTLLFIVTGCNLQRSRLGSNPRDFNHRLIYKHYISDKLLQLTFFKFYYIIYISIFCSNVIRLTRTYPQT